MTTDMAPPAVDRTDDEAGRLTWFDEHALATFLQEGACMFRCAEREKIVNRHRKQGWLQTAGNELDFAHDRIRSRARRTPHAPHKSVAGSPEKGHLPATRPPPSAQESADAPPDIGSLGDVHPGRGGLAVVGLVGLHHRIQVVGTGEQEVGVRRAWSWGWSP